MAEEKKTRRWIVQRAVLPIIEQSPEPGTVHPEEVDHAITLLPVRDPARLTEDGVVWEDFAEREVPVGTQRNTVVQSASAEIPDEELPQFFRALAEDEAPIPVRVEVPKAPPRRIVG